MTRLGLIAGNGTFPLLVLDAARAQGCEVIVVAIKEETFPEIESRGAAFVHAFQSGARLMAQAAPAVRQSYLR